MKHLLLINISTWHAMYDGSCVSFPSEDWEIADSTLQFWCFYLFIMKLLLFKLGSRADLWNEMCSSNGSLNPRTLSLCRCSLAGYILGLDADRGENVKSVKILFFPVFSALLDALLLRSQVSFCFACILTADCFFILLLCIPIHKLLYWLTFPLNSMCICWILQYCYMIKILCCTESISDNWKKILSMHLTRFSESSHVYKIIVSPGCILNSGVLSLWSSGNWRKSMPLGSLFWNLMRYQ